MQSVGTVGFSLRQRRRRIFWGALGALGGAVLAGGAQAQSTLPGGLAGAGPPLPEGRNISVSVNEAANYHTNVVGGEEIVATIKGLRKDDITYTTSATINGAIPLGPGSVYVTGNVGYTFHQYNSELNGPVSSIQAGFSGPLKIGPCALSAILGYTAAASDTSQLMLQTVKNIQTQERLGGSVVCSTGGAISENLSVVHFVMNNSSKTTATNSSGTSISGGVSYRNRTLGDLMVFGSYSKTDYDIPGGTLSAGQQALVAQGFEGYSAGVQLARPFGARLNGSASLGYTLSKPLGGLVSQSSGGLTGSGSLSYRLNSRISATFVYDRAQTASIQLGSSFSTTDEVSMNASYALGPRITTSIGYRLYRREEHISDPALFAASSGLGFPFLGATRETGNGETASAGLRIGRNGQLSLNLARTYRNTNLTVFNYTDYSAGLSLSERF